ncbi:MAG: hypothetical protein LBR23_00790, partial [Spirochaetaceae bacterium]|nr:hypothetical protein [Spirochaetaceae bacterium]
APDGGGGFFARIAGNMRRKRLAGANRRLKNTVLYYDETINSRKALIKNRIDELVISINNLTL